MKNGGVFISIKLIATDLDGTLMSGDHLTVSPRTVAALQAAHDRGVCLAIATGRTLDFIDHVTAQVPFVDYVIYSNGAAVYDRKNDAHICQQLIPPKAVQRILQTLAPQPLYYNVYWDGGMYLEEARLPYYNSDSLPRAVLEQYMAKAHREENLLDKADKGAESIAVYDLNPEQADWVRSVLESQGLEVVSSLPNELECTAPGANKGAALAGIARQLKIEPEQVMSFGDAGNDCPMLAFAHYSFAMENGAPECKAAARYRAEANTADGVAKAIEQYVLAD